MKPLFAILALAALPAFAFAADEVAEGKPCRLEGERAYVESRDYENSDDVYVCENGSWRFLYTRGPDDGQD